MIQTKDKILDLIHISKQTQKDSVREIVIEKERQS